MQSSSKKTKQMASQLFDAIDNGNLEKALQLFNQGLDRDCIFDGYTPLEYAVEQGKIEVIRFLILAGCSIDFGVSGHPMEAAILSNRLDIFLEFLQAGVNVNQEVSEHGWSLLMTAISAGNLEMIEHLIERGANVNIVTERGLSALMWAAENGRKEIFDYLAPLCEPEIVKQATKELPQGLLYRARKEDRLAQNFIEAAGFGDVDAVKKLIKNGININVINKRGTNALHFATSCNKLEIIQILVENGANLEFTHERYGTTSLIEGAKWGKDAIVRFLIESGADINAKDFEGNTAMDYARRANHSKTIQLLQDAGKTKF